MNMVQSNDPMEALKMETYQSIKLLMGRPMSRAEFHHHREGMRLQFGDDFVSKHYALLAHDTDEPGYLVKYLDGPYFSWSPKDVFENGHVRVGLKPGDSGLRFGQAQICLERGQRVTRAGWNGKGLWLEFVPGHDQDLPFIRMHYPVGSAAYPDGARVPWLASQTDVLAKDWMVVG